MIEKLRALLHSMSEIRAFSYFKTIFETLDGILFGVRDRVPMAPHLRDNIEIKRFMSAAIIALLPATAAAVVFYGWYALAIILVSYVAGGVTEVAFALIRRRHIEEGFLVTGLIFPLVLPPTSPLGRIAARRSTAACPSQLFALETARPGSSVPRRSAASPTIQRSPSWVSPSVGA